jgi:hypothetical protein
VADSGTGKVDLVTGQTLTGSPAVGLTTPAGVAVAAPPPALTADTPPTTAPANQAFTYDYQAGNNEGAPNYFTVVSGTLPHGLTLNSSSGALSGKPTVPGTYTFTVAAESDAARASFAPPATITVGPPAAFKINKLTFSGSAAAPTLTLTGVGFGTEATLGTPQTPCGSPVDTTGKNYGGNFWLADTTADWNAGDSAPPACNQLGLEVTSYSSSKIVFSPGSTYPSYGALNAGDSVTINLFGASYSTTVNYS